MTSGHRLAQGAPDALRVEAGEQSATTTMGAVLLEKRCVWIRGRLRHDRAARIIGREELTRSALRFQGEPGPALGPSAQ